MDPEADIGAAATFGTSSASTAPARLMVHTLSGTGMCWRPELGPCTQAIRISVTSAVISGAVQNRIGLDVRSLVNDGVIAVGRSRAEQPTSKPREDIPEGQVGFRARSAERSAFQNLGGGHCSRSRSHSALEVSSAHREHQEEGDREHVCVTLHGDRRGHADGPVPTMRNNTDAIAATSVVPREMRTRENTRSAQRFDQRAQQLLALEGLGHVAVHARLLAALHFLLHHVGGHGHDGDA